MSRLAVPSLWLTLSTASVKKDGARRPRPDNSSGRRWLPAASHHSSVKAMMMLPRLKSSWTLPPAATTMYYLPATM
jgi:hypothetical protein